MIYEKILYLTDNYNDINIIFNKKDKEEINKAISNVFLFSYGQIDRDKNKLIEKINKFSSYKDAINIIRKNNIIYGYAILIGEDQAPCIEMDISGLEGIVDNFMDYNYRGWLTNRAMDWCIEVNRTEVILYLPSPFIKRTSL